MEGSSAPKNTFLITLSQVFLLHGWEAGFSAPTGRGKRHRHLGHPDSSRAIAPGPPANKVRMWKSFSPIWPAFTPEVQPKNKIPIRSAQSCNPPQMKHLDWPLSGPWV